MNLAGRMLRSLFVLTLFVLTAVLFYNSLSGEWLSGLWSFTDSLGNRISLFESLRKGEQLEHERRAAYERSCAKIKVIEELMNGERTLIEAAACFRSINEDARNWCSPNRPWPAPEDGEGWCREVIGWAVRKTYYELSPSQADAVRQQLEAQLQNHLQYHGRVTLVD